MMMRKIAKDIDVPTKIKINNIRRISKNKTARKY